MFVSHYLLCTIKKCLFHAVIRFIVLRNKNDLFIFVKNKQINANNALYYFTEKTFSQQTTFLSYGGKSSVKIIYIFVYLENKRLNLHIKGL